MHKLLISWICRELSERFTFKMNPSNTRNQYLFYLPTKIHMFLSPSYILSTANASYRFDLLHSFIIKPRYFNVCRFIAIISFFIYNWFFLYSIINLSLFFFYNQLLTVTFNLFFPNKEYYFYYHKPGFTNYYS